MLSPQKYNGIKIQAQTSDTVFSLYAISLEIRSEPDRADALYAIPQTQFLQYHRRTDSKA